VAYGLSTTLLGFYVMTLNSPASVAYMYTYLCWGLVGGGLVVAGLGWRKFRRRNAPAAAKS
jgi:hypothetical protein